MLQVARLAPKQLGESRDLVIAFLEEQRNPDGGFRDRAGSSDLYYTVFGLEGLIAMQADPHNDSTVAYARGFGDGEHLDFVHLACLARVWASISPDAAPAKAILARIESFRSPDGGYHPSRGSAVGSLYAAFLALGAYQDLHGEMPKRNRLISFVEACQTREGGYANQPGISAGLTPTTAAAVTLLRQLDSTAAPETAAWLLGRYCNDGGFSAGAGAPMPDLLSTATALHALTSLHVNLHKIRETCLDFIDTLWTNRGGFCGSWTDPILDCEYTYYGLLALGHLTL